MLYAFTLVQIWTSVHWINPMEIGLRKSRRAQYPCARASSVAELNKEIDLYLISDLGTFSSKALNEK